MKNLLNVKVVFGSWKAYNECNERALGSSWLDMSDFESVEDIYEELKKQGFTDEELEETFIQYIDCDVELFENCDYVNIERCFETLEKIDDNNIDKDFVNAFIEAYSLSELMRVIEKYRLDDIYFYKGQTLEEVAYDLMNETMEIPEYLENYIDYKAYARFLSFNGFKETQYGVIEWRKSNNQGFRG